MCIKDNLCYDASQDCVEGLEDFGNAGRSSYIANHASVFMVRGLVQKWKQPVGYFTTTGPMTPSLLKTSLLSCIEQVQLAGLIPKVVICDKGSNNRSMLASLGVTVSNPTFTCNGVTIVAMYDPPHLLKSIRNNLMRNGFMVGANRVSWQYVKEFHAIDAALPIRMAPRLTAKHIELPPSVP